MTGEASGEMTNLDDEDEEHQMERRLYGRRWKEYVHGDQKRSPEATLQELG